MQSVQLGKYQHYKGKEYLVVGIAKHSETLEDLVIYESLYDNETSKLWVRPLRNFLAEVNVDGQILPRFKFIE